MSSQLAAQYPHISYPHRVHLARRNKRTDDGPVNDHTAIHRGLYALILRENGASPEAALRVAYERYPDHARA